MFEMADNNKKQVIDGRAKIRVIGVGGGGCNAVNTMIRSGLEGVEYIVANTDLQSLNASLAPTKVQLGVEITKGLGAGANPDVGRKAALEEYEKLSEVLSGADMVFITAGMGGGTGTGAAPVIAKLSKELGALTVGVVTKPFVFEGKKRFRQAENGINDLEESVDSLITIPNQRLLYLAGESLSLVETFKKADAVLLNAVRGISDLINNTGHINADFADVSTVMTNKGFALMGMGIASGEDRAIKAANEAISSPLLEDISIDGATGIIINITGSSDMTMHETNEAVTLIMEAADEEADIIFGTVIDDAMEDRVKVTVIATGLGGLDRVTSASVKKEEKHEQLKAKSVAAEEVREAREVRETREFSSRDDSIAAMREETERSMPSRGEHSVDDVKSDRYDDRFRSFVTGSTERRSSLADTIKSAATEYERDETITQPKERVVAPQRKENIQQTPGRARSIAEKLGFISFDEEELDRPTFLRRRSENNGETFPTDL